MQSDAPVKIQQADYETDEEVTLSCEENWGDAYTTGRSLPLQLADVVNDLLRGTSDKRILDLNAERMESL